MEALTMKVVGVISTAVLFLLLGATRPAFAQEEHHEEAAKPAQHEEQAKPEKQEAAKPAQHEEQAKPAKQEEKAKPATHAAQSKPAQARPVKQEEKQAAPAKQQSPAKQENHANNGGQQHAQRTQAEVQRQHAVPALRLSVRGSGRIPDDRFRSNFGQSHVFVISQPVIVGGYSRFQYGGYYFGFVEPWPDGWYYTDDVYVDYIDGEYFLFNPYDPGVRVGISVVL
jgi:hypothetical protein